MFGILSRVKIQMVPADAVIHSKANRFAEWKCRKCSCCAALAYTFQSKLLGFCFYFYDYFEISPKNV